MRYNLPSFLECETVRPHLRSARRQRRSERFKASPNTERAKLSATRQLGPFSMLCLWAALCFGGGLYASWQDSGGRAFAATLTVFSFYFGVMFLFAARGVPDFLPARLGAGAAYLLGAATLFAYLIYAIGTNTFAFSRAGAIAALIFL